VGLSLEDLERTLQEALLLVKRVREAELLHRIQKSGFVAFRAKDIIRLIGGSRSDATKLLRRLLREGVVVRVARGIYALASETSDPLTIACHAVWPSYVGLRTALVVHGWLSEPIDRIFLLTTARTRLRQICGREVVTVRIRDSLFFGYRPLNHGYVSDPEKTLIDCLLFPRYVPLLTVWRILCRAYRDSRLWLRLIDYALYVNKPSLNRRLGYLLERAGLASERVLCTLRRRIGRGFVRLDPHRPPAGRYDRRWLLDVNVELPVEEA